MTTTRADVLEQPPPLPMRRFTVAEYHRLAEVGLLTDEDRVELLGGWLIKKMIHNPLHDATVARSSRVIQGPMPVGWHVRVQSAITTADSEPEPDLALVRGSEERYARRHPRGEDVALLVEVAETSLKRDRDLKGRLYAEAGVPVYWLINVDRQVEVYSLPAPSDDGMRYSQRKDFKAGERIRLVVDGVEVGTVLVDDLFVA